MEFKKSQIEAIGIAVSYETKLGGIGFGYQLPKECYKNDSIKNVVWVSGGNGFYYPHEMVKVFCDGGEYYMNKAKGLI